MHRCYDNSTKYGACVFQENSVYLTHDFDIYNKYCCIDIFAQYCFINKLSMFDIQAINNNKPLQKIIKNNQLNLKSFDRSMFVRANFAFQSCILFFNYYIINYLLVQDISL